MNPLRNGLDRWLGRAEASITTPPLDGAFRPNQLLDSAPEAMTLPAPDCLAVTAPGLIVSSERSLFLVGKSTRTPVISFDVAISALTGLPDGGVAVALLDGRIVFVGGVKDGGMLESVAGQTCITALVPCKDGSLLAANGSALHGPGEWKHDLMSKGASGSVWRIETDSGRRTQIAGGLAYPYGLIEEQGSIVVSESWRSALTRLFPNGRRSNTVLDTLPGYPSRMWRGADNSIWLALFAPRSQLIEFVLREDRYRKRMMGEIHSDYWIAPSLRSGRQPLEPVQQGGVKQLGVLKPWSPNGSYGLIARLDSAYNPVISLHSRADGRRHGVTSCLVDEGRLFFVAKGDGVVASLNLQGVEP